MPSELATLTVAEYDAETWECIDSVDVPLARRQFLRGEIGLGEFEAELDRAVDRLLDASE